MKKDKKTKIKIIDGHPENERLDINDFLYILNEYGEFIDPIIMDEFKPIIDKVAEYLDLLLKDKETCPKCGAILPELEIQLDDKIYQFVCYQIRDINDNILRKTDYSKFRKFFSEGK